MTLLKENSEAIKTLCKKYKVEKLYAFGSVLTRAFNEESDVDFLVNFKDQEIEKFVSNFFNMKKELESLLAEKQN